MDDRSAHARRRAPGMSPERRRAMIVQVALPLLAEYGSGVTTSQIARAAGIGEATIFRAFTDKDELLEACVAEVLRPDHVVEQIAAIPLDQPLPDRLEEAATAMEAHMARLGAVLGAVAGAGRRPHARTPHRLPEHDRLHAAPDPSHGGPDRGRGGAQPRPGTDAHRRNTAPTGPGGAEGSAGYELSEAETGLGNAEPGLGGVERRPGGTDHEPGSPKYESGGAEQGAGSSKDEVGGAERGARSAEYEAGGAERGVGGAEGRRAGVQRGSGATERRPVSADYASGGAGYGLGGAERGLGGIERGSGERGVGDGRRGVRGVDRDASFRRTQEALAELFVPERASLRLPPDELAGIFLGFVFNRARGAHGGEGSGPSIRDVLDVFLYGALSRGEDA